MFRQIHCFRAGLYAAVLAGAIPALAVNAVQAQVSSAIEASSVRLGQQAPSSQVTGMVWLRVRNKAALDAAVEAMYTSSSARYHKFGDAASLQQFAPTSAQMTAVKKELSAHNLAVVSTDAHNFSVQVAGQTSDLEAAFHTTVEQYRTPKGKTMIALASRPVLGGAATGMVSAVTGITRSVMKPYWVAPVNPATGKQVGIYPVAARLKSQGAFFSPNCFYLPQATAITTPGSVYPDGLYYGVLYGAPPTNTKAGTVSPCGYSPSDYTKLYGLNTAYQGGYKGAGQTIAIVDAFGSPTIQNDLATFDSIYGLPAPTLTVHRTAAYTATNAGWAGETTLDVEWAHAIAPAAKILLVNTPAAYNSDLQAGVLYVVENHLANVISNSYGLGEYESSLQDLTTWDEICELASFEGISVNFATGDDGDLQAAEGLGATDVSSPADSPYATAVGGTSAAFNPLDGSLLQTGWGNNLTELGSPAGADDPPKLEGFIYGAGGGVSQVFAKPSYQASLTGSGRELPDVSALADPDTGVEIILTTTVNGVTGQYYEVIGGTSLATPIFSAEYALVEQAAGRSLGQAAPMIAKGATIGGISDVVPPPDQYSAYGLVLDASGVKTYSPSALATPETAAGFLSTVYNAGGGYYYDLSFATDSSLPVTTGWDPVTGWGTLNLTAIFSNVGLLK